MKIKFFRGGWILAAAAGVWMTQSCDESDPGAGPLPAEAPKVTLSAPLVNGTEVSFLISATDAAQLAYMVVPSAETAPDAASILSDGVYIHPQGATVTVKDLALDTEYRILAAAANDAGSSLSPEQRFSTRKAPRLSVTAGETTPIKIAFQIAAEEAVEGSYLVRKSGEPAADAATIFSEGVKLNLSQEARTIEVTDVDAETGYVVYAAASNGGVLSAAAIALVTKPMPVLKVMEYTPGFNTVNFTLSTLHLDTVKCAVIKKEDIEAGKATEEMLTPEFILRHLSSDTNGIVRITTLYNLSYENALLPEQIKESASGLAGRRIPYLFKAAASDRYGIVLGDEFEFITVPVNLANCYFADNRQYISADSPHAWSITFDVTLEDDRRIYIRTYILTNDEIAKVLPGKYVKDGETHYFDPDIWRRGYEIHYFYFTDPEGNKHLGAEDSIFEITLDGDIYTLHFDFKDKEDPGTVFQADIPAKLGKVTNEYNATLYVLSYAGD